MEEMFGKMDEAFENPVQGGSGKVGRVVSKGLPMMVDSSRRRWNRKAGGVLVVVAWEKEKGEVEEGLKSWLKEEERGLVKVVVVPYNVSSALKLFSSRQC